MTRSFGTGETLKGILAGIGYVRPGVAATMSLHARAVCFARCLLQFRRFRDWFGNTRNPALREALAERPSLVACVGRPYLNVHWPAARKLDTIRAHYRLLSGELAAFRFDPAAHLAVASLGGELSLRIDRAPWFEHEGELTLSLFDGSLRLYSLVFTIGLADDAAEDRHIAYVGALQGLGSPEALGIYRELTRRFHGLRPRDLMVTVFRQLCAAIGVGRILAVTDAASVSRSAYFHTANRVHGSYDEAWSENGGRVMPGGFYELPVGFSPRAGVDIPARKRALYRRRYELLGELDRQIDIAVRRPPVRIHAAPPQLRPAHLARTPETSP